MTKLTIILKFINYFKVIIITYSNEYGGYTSMCYVIFNYFVECVVSYFKFYLLINNITYVQKVLKVLFV